MTSIVLCGAVRTPIGQFLGTLSDIPTVELGAICAQETIKRSKIPVDKIDEVILGHVLAAGDGQNPARQVAKKAGLANEVPAIQSSVLCGSGLRSVIDGVRKIKKFDISIIPKYLKWINKGGACKPIYNPVFSPMFSPRTCIF